MKIRTTGADDYSRNMKVLIVGEPGSGKTLISSTFPKPFFVSAEGGLMSIADKAVPYVEVEHSSELHDVHTLLKNTDLNAQHGLEVETVVIDTIDEIQRILISERMEAEKIDAFRIQDWGWLGEQMAAICRGFRNMPYHVVFTCHLKETKDEDSGTIVYRPALSGAIADQLPGYVDLSLCIRVQQGLKMVDEKAEQVMERKLLTFPTKKFAFLKDRSGKLPKEFDVDLATDYARMSELIYGDLALPESGSVSIPDKAIEVSTGEILEDPEPVVTNEATATKVAEAVKEEPKAKETEETPAEAEEGAPKCEVCGTTDLGGVDPELSKLAHRKVLCAEHFKEAQDAAAKAKANK